MTQSNQIEAVQRPSDQMVTHFWKNRLYHKLLKSIECDELKNRRESADMASSEPFTLVFDEVVTTISDFVAPRPPML